MDSDNEPSKVHGDDVVEFDSRPAHRGGCDRGTATRSGIPATVGADSVYPSVTFADGVPIFVRAEDARRAEALLEGDDELE